MIRFLRVREVQNTFLRTVGFVKKPVTDTLLEREDFICAFIIVDINSGKLFGAG